MKSGFLTITLCSLTFVLAACGGSSSSGNKSNNSSSAPASSAPVSSSAAAISSSTPASSEPASSSVLSSSTSSSSSLVVSSSSSSDQPSSSSNVSTSVSSSSSSSSSTPVAQTGVFVDSAVAGIHYDTAPGGFSGITSAEGHYQFAEGDKVVFSLGNLKFPEVPAKGVVTPVDIAQAADPANAERIKTNIAALLQSLDTDGNPDNGISINTAAATVVATAVDFNQPYTNFAASTAVTNLVANSGSVTTTLVSETAALAHLEESLKKLLVGAWYVKGDTYQYALFVIDGQRYAAIDYDSAEANGAALETGTYSWDQETGLVTLSNVTRTDSDLDANPPLANGNLLKLNGNVLTLTDGDETFTLSRLLPTEQSPLQGGWVVPDADITVAFAFTGTHYLMGQMGTKDNDGKVFGEDEAGQSGVELGTYTYDRTNNAIKVDTEVDTNGQWGLSHPCAVLSDQHHQNYEDSNFLDCGPDGREIVQTLTITGDMATFISEADTISEGEEQETTFERINGVPDGDIHLKLEVSVEFSEYVQGEKFSRDGGNKTMQCGYKSYPAVGATEINNEAWILGSNPNRPTWVGTFPATYNPETKSITFDVREPNRPVVDNEYFSEQFWEKLSITYNAGEANIIAGTYEEGYDLTWEYDDSVSTCKLIYSVIGVLR